MSHFPFFAQELEKIANAKLRAMEMFAGAVPGAALGVGMVRQDRGNEPMGDPEIAAGLLGAGAGALGAGLSSTLIRHLRTKKAVDKAIEKAEGVAKKDHRAKILRMGDEAQVAYEKQIKELRARETKAGIKFADAQRGFAAEAAKEPPGWNVVRRQRKLQGHPLTHADEVEKVTIPQLDRRVDEAAADYRQKEAARQAAFAGPKQNMSGAGLAAAAAKAHFNSESVLRQEAIDFVAGIRTHEAALNGFKRTMGTLRAKLEAASTTRISVMRDLDTQLKTNPMDHPDIVALRRQDGTEGVREEARKEVGKRLADKFFGLGSIG